MSEFHSREICFRKRKHQTTPPLLKNPHPLNAPSARGEGCLLRGVFAIIFAAVAKSNKEKTSKEVSPKTDLFYV